MRQRRGEHDIVCVSGKGSMTLCMGGREDMTCVSAIYSQKEEDVTLCIGGGGGGGGGGLMCVLVPGGGGCDIVYGGGELHDVCVGARRRRRM